MNGCISAILLTLFIALIVILWFIYKWYQDTKVRKHSGSVVEVVSYCFVASILTYILGYWVVGYVGSLFVPI